MPNFPIAESPVTSISELPMRPAVYALFGGGFPPRQYAYIGIAEKLRVRLRQHLILRDSSVTTGAAVAGLRVEHVRGVVWWEHPSFTLVKPKGSRRDDRPALEAAEVIAENVLQPTLRGRGRASKEARGRLDDADFSQQMRALFEGEPTGRLELPTLADLADKVKALEKRIASLENS